MGLPNFLLLMASSRVWEVCKSTFIFHQQAFGKQAVSHCQVLVHETWSVSASKHLASSLKGQCGFA